MANKQKAAAAAAGQGTAKTQKKAPVAKAAAFGMAAQNIHPPPAIKAQNIHPPPSETGE